MLLEDQFVLKMLVTYQDTVKPVHVVTSIKQLPVFKVHIFPSCHSKFHIKIN